MSPARLAGDDFPAFFRELWGAGYSPFPWQGEFARRLCVGQVPDYVAVPTGSGKTACLDAAVFALAVQAAAPMSERTQGRRIFFIVNRRVIVDEAYDRAGELCKKLRHAAPDSVMGRVAAALRGLSAEADAAPLSRTQLRGGIYRDRSWAGSLLQPMIICSTVDQAGSRLLFRGYGVSPAARPIHASLVAQDSLLIVDEAHISRPFIQTLEWVKRYRLYQPAGGETVRLPFQLIQMTATPPADTRDDQKIALGAGDHEHPILKPRLRAVKPARLIVETKAKGKAREAQMATRLAEEAEKILAEEQPRSIAIMVNRVDTARSVAEKLKKNHEDRVKLLIGRLRPIDREATTNEIQKCLKTGAARDHSESGPLVVVSTQCLEVGADLDFDALVTEAASLDALRQRFGRLNRGGREIPAHAVIILPGDQDLSEDKLDDESPCDFIYGNAIPRTWRWLHSLAQDRVVDFGINAMASAVETLRRSDNQRLSVLLSPTGDAQILLPAYLDCWVQTNPAPAADPDVALFLHGPQREMAEVQVCWRGDLPQDRDSEAWADILSLCPPTTAECLPVPLHVFRDWLDSKGKFEDFSGDVPENRQPHDGKKDDDKPRVVAFVWGGPDDRFFADDLTKIRPGDTIVLRVQGGGWQALGHVPGAPADPAAAPRALNPRDVRCVDVAEQAMARVRRRAVLRIHPALWDEAEPGTPAAMLKEMAFDPEKDWRRSEIKDLLARLVTDPNPGWALTAGQREAIEHLADKRVRIDVEPYSDGQGFVLIGRDLLPIHDSDETDEAEETDADELLAAAQPLELCHHTQDVLTQVEGVLALLPLEAWREALIAAAALHDWGKIDVRFQAMLRGAPRFATAASEIILAKSGSMSSSSATRRAARKRAELPEGFRHEMLSMQMAESAVGRTALPREPLSHALTLHLIATHHGYGRPFAPVVEDEVPPEVSLAMKKLTVLVTSLERLDHPAHALDSGITERFWQLTRHYGWWGLALLETVLRLADQTASAKPGKS